jgi:hypothetical protein
MKIKMITGFRKEQAYSIDEEEAMKAYYLFENPEKRAIFKNGLAIIGQDIRAIEPDWHGTMGWNPDHKLTTDDWNEIRSSGVERKMKELMAELPQIARLPNAVNMTLSEAKQLLLNNKN